MNEPISVFDWSNHITKALSQGILLNTFDEKFNSMVIGWGHIGVIWGKPTFVAYVRENRYTKARLDRTREFTISVPLDRPDPEINRICGSLSGRNVDKAELAHLTLVKAETVAVPAVAQYPLTLECKVLYSQKQELSSIPDDILKRAYPQDVDGTHPMANRDAHTAYIGQIERAYIIKP